MNTRILAEISQLNAEHRLVFANICLLDFHDLLRLDDLADAISLQDKVWQVVPQGAFVNDDLNRHIDIPADAPRVGAVFQVRHFHEIVVAYGGVGFWYDLNLSKAVLDHFSLKSAV